MSGYYHDINLTDFLLALNEPITPISHHYYRHNMHDSLVIDTQKNYFHWNSQNVSGGVIQYLMAVKGMSKAKAMSVVHEVMTSGKVESHTPHHTIKEPFSYDTTNEVAAYDFSYLKKRGVSDSLIKTLSEKNLIAFNKQRQIIFKWYDSGKFVGCSIQGTTPLSMNNQKKYSRIFYKQIHKNSLENWGFNLNVGSPKKMMVFESPIDLISFINLHQASCQNAFLVSLEGLKKGTLLNFIEYGNKRYKIDKINICVDNDKSGITFAKEFEKYEKFERIQPKNKDWNEDLISKIEKKTKGIER